jgi:peroxiredoxin
VVLHFWATWCPICRGEVSKLTRIHEQFAHQGVLILAVSVDENLTALGEFVRTAALPYPVIADQAPFPIATQYRVQGIPTTYILAPDGRTALRFFGGADLVRAVEHVLERSPAPTRS